MAAAWMNAAELPRLLAPAQMVVPVIGAGIGERSGLPDGPALAEWLIDANGLDVPEDQRDDLFTVVDLLRARGMTTSDLQKAVAEHLKAIVPKPVALVERLVSVPSRVIITLNYDDSIAMSAEAVGIQADRLALLDLDDQQKIYDAVVGMPGPPDRLTVVHLHGHVERPSTIVLDSRTYDRIGEDTGLLQVMGALTQRGTLMFLATKLDEPYLLTLLQRLLTHTQHVLLTKNETSDAISAGRGAVRPRNKVHVVGYPDHDDLLDVADFLTDSGTATGSPEAQSAATPDDGYVPVELRQRLAEGEQVDDGRTGLFGELFAGPRADREVTQEDLLLVNRLLVVGAPGSGKSRLLEEVAGMESPLRTVRLRLAGLSFRSGQPDRILRHWVEKGDNGEGLTDEDVLRGRLRVLLDGFDEIAIDQQQSAIKVIKDVVDAFPQHFYVVSSRPIAALTAFSGDPSGAATPTDWTRVDLTSSARWRDRYLEGRGVSFAALCEGLPALSDAADLLTVPFFLVETLRLYERGDLGGLRDVGDLLGRFVTSALRKEEEHLEEIDIAVAHQWLRTTALRIAIAGQRTFGLDKLPEVPVPGPTAGDLQQLVDQLQLRLLLQEHDGDLRFTHRLLADELAAQALAEIEPSEPLLDAIVPKVDDLLAGVRDDLVVMVGLLCLRAPAWRAEVSERDPLAAARGVPTDADLDERQAAISLILDTYDRWGVWMWDYQQADLVEDSEVLGRLLSVEPPDSQFLQAMHQRLYDGDDQQQGNAIRILSRVKPPGFDDDLKVILADPDRDGVVIRQAAIAAADLKYEDLIDDLLTVAVTTTDTAVGQDTVGALSRLTPDDRLLEVAVALTASRGSRHLYPGSLRRRLSARDRITYALRLGEADDDHYRTDAQILTEAVRDLADDEVDGGVIAQAAQAAAHWQMVDEQTSDLLDRDPAATARGVLAGLAADLEWWQVAEVAEHADPDVLRAAGVDERVVQAAERGQRLRQGPTQQPSVPQPVVPVEPPDRPPMQLAQWLVSDDPTDAQRLLTHALRLQSQVKRLDENEKAQLSERVLESWPQDRPFEDLFTSEGDTSFSVEPPGSAWLFYGPQLDLPVTEDQWVQIALAPYGVVTSVAEWLARHRTDAAVIRAANTLTSNDPDRWLRLIHAAGRTVPAALIDRCCQTVDCRDGEPRAIQFLAEELVRGGITEPVRALADRDLVFAQALLPIRADHNERDAQRELLTALVADVRASRIPDRDDISWLGSLEDEEFLDDLFEIVEHTYGTAREEPEITTAAWGSRDVLNPTFEAIRRIGGRKAVRLYDQLLERGADFRWLRESRDRVAAAVLLDRGRRHAQDALATVS